MKKNGTWKKSSVFCVDNILEDSILYKEEPDGFSLALAYDDGLHIHRYFDMDIAEVYGGDSIGDDVFTIMNVVAGVMKGISYGTLVDFGGDSMILIFDDNGEAFLYNTKFERVMEVDYEEDILDYDDLGTEGSLILDLMKE